MEFTNIIDNTVSSNNVAGSLITIPTLDELNNKLDADNRLSYDSNGNVTVPFVYDITIIFPDIKDDQDNVISEGKHINGQIKINVVYTKELTKELYTDPNVQTVTGYSLRGAGVGNILN